MTASGTGAPFTGHDGAVRAVAFTRDGGRLVTGGADGTVRLWDLETGVERGHLAAPDGDVLAVALTQNNLRVVICTDDGQRHSIELDTGHTIDLPPLRATALTVAAIAPDAERIVTAQVDDKVRVWTRGGSVVAEPAVPLESREHVSDVAATADGVIVLTRGDQGQRRLVTLTADHTVLSAIPTDLLADASAVRLTSDGQYLVASYADHLKVWRLPGPTTEPLTQLVLRGTRVRAAAVSPDQRLLVTGHHDGAIHVWELATGALVTGTGRPRRSMPPRAGVRSDRESATDLLGFTGDVHTLAALITDRDTEPPLSIALLGRWGSGKSSFMRQLQDRVDQLTSRPSTSPHGVFAGTVRQIRFNAWHYSDDHLWVGLVEHLFAGLPGTPAEEERPELGARRDSLRAQQRLLEHELASRVSPLDWLRLLWRARATTPAEHRRHQVIIAAAVVTGLAALAAGWLWSSVAVAVAGAGAALVAGLSPLLTGLADGLRAVGRLSGSLRDRFRQRKALVDTELAKVDATYRLARLIEEARSARYEQYRGLLSQVHQDLHRLSEDARDAVAQWRADPAGPPPLERVVLYVDDLDRCPPRKVVEVLAAVHLLLALPLFVVVVAVDPRWLRRCLEQYHAELFVEEHERAHPGGNGSPTPMDYLDKIFQVPFALRPMGAGAERFIATLLPASAAAAVAPDRAAGASVAGTSSAGRPAPAAGVHAASAGGPGRPAPDPQPEPLRLRTEEQQFVQRLRPLLDTPRAVKRLVNLYRLVRIGIRDGQLDRFIRPDGGGPYQAVLVLLAITVSAPGSARTLIDRLRSSSGDGGHAADIVDLLAGTGDQRLAEVAELLATIRERVVLHGNLATYREWAGTVARFSFETCDLVAAQGMHTEPAVP